MAGRAYVTFTVGMSDIYSRAKRSALMAAIQGRDNQSTELALVRCFRTHGITGWRRHQTAFGKPDFVFPQLRLALFVDGCFWHGCPRHYREPAGNRAYWQKKIERNRLRDGRVNRTLRQKGWRVLRIWEHELAVSRKGRLISRIRRALGG